MTEKALPKAVWEGTFTIMGTPIRCYVLDDGSRIVNADDFMAMLDAGENEIDPVELHRFNAWREAKHE